MDPNDHRGWWTRMKDHFGMELVVGDAVVYVAGSGKRTLIRGTVVGFTAKKVKLQSEDRNALRYPKDVIKVPAGL